MGVRHPQPGEAGRGARRRRTRLRARCWRSTPSRRRPTASSCRSTPRSAATSRLRAPTTRTRRGSTRSSSWARRRGRLAVRCYIDEILIPRLPPPDKLQAQMFIRGTNTKIPLEFVRVQPYVSPKIELSNERQERVDLRVLPVIFRFTPPAGRAGLSRARWSTSTSERRSEGRSARVLAPPACSCGAAPSAPTSSDPRRRTMQPTRRSPRSRRQSPTARGSDSSRAQVPAEDWWRDAALPGARRRSSSQALAANPGLDAARATLRQNQDSCARATGSSSRRSTRRPA